MSKLGTRLASDIKYYLDYDKWDEAKGRYETWEESVDRVMDMHRSNPKLKPAFSNPKFQEYFEFATRAYKSRLVLGSQRALQFGGDAILKHNSKIYNCLTSYVDRVAFFQECMYWLLSGCGVGFSVQFKHIKKLPLFGQRNKGTKTFVIPDSIEGWSDACGVLMSSFVHETQINDCTFPEYQGYIVHFDFSQIRPEGAYINGGFKAPGPEPLRHALTKVEELLNKHTQTTNSITPIIAYDVVMYMSDAVLSGGVRRSATICLFSSDDKEMMDAKIYPNYLPQKINPQRARSNNSVVLIREKSTLEQFRLIFEKIKEFGEPGFVFVDDEDQCVNPCVEIGMWPQTEDGRSGWQGCNLTEGNAGICTTKEKFLEACKALAILGTIQASYTDFVYVGKESKEIFDREALLGCSFTGWMTNPKIMLNPEIQKEGAALVKQINKEVAEMIGINPAARTTCVKPSGNASVLLETSSGIHAEHSPQYFRMMQINKQTEVAKYLAEHHSHLIEESYWSQNKSDYVVYIPVTTRPGSLYKADLKAIDFLDIVKSVQQNWVEYGTDVELCIKPFLRHNVSNTVDIKEGEWDEVVQYLFDNKQWFTGVSFVGAFADKDVIQAPFTSIMTPEQIFNEYGDASLFAAGLIVDGLQAFDNNLWDACNHINIKDLPVEGTRLQVLIKKDWIRRARQFAKRYFKGDIKTMTYCLKDLHLYHKWVEVIRETKVIDFTVLNTRPEYIDVNTLGAVACVGNQCEIPYLVQNNADNTTY